MRGGPSSPSAFAVSPPTALLSGGEHRGGSAQGTREGGQSEGRRGRRRRRGGQKGRQEELRYKRVGSSERRPTFLFKAPLVRPVNEGLQ